jgi:hypothetical protein
MVLRRWRQQVLPKHRQNFYQSTSEKTVFFKNNKDASIKGPLGVT